CHRIVSNTDLQPTPGSCNQVHTMFCDTGYQNSWREMKYLFGDPIPDTTAPKLEITSPIDGETYVLPITIPLLGTITDDLDPQFYTIQLLPKLDGNDIPGGDSRTDVDLDLLLTDPPAGDWEMTVSIKDEAGNEGRATVSFTILKEGSELPAQSDDEIVD